VRALSGGYGKKIYMVYSRENEDEVIQGLIAKFPGILKVCVDVGAQSIKNNNIANLVINHGWEGFFIEKGRKSCAELMQRLKYHAAYVIYAHVTPKNINDILPRAFDILSLDIDGQDYWVWEAIEHKPKIAIIEFNSRRNGIMSRDDDFDWKRLSREIGVDEALKQIGASRAAMIDLGGRKGYAKVAENENNLFFVRED
jgi:hypothetical protein